MPKLVITPSSSPVSSGSSESVTVLAFDGFIDAANYLAFEKGLEKAYAAGARFAILDFERVHYINSTGISVIIRYFELFRDCRGVLCLANVAKEVGLSMHLLGITSFVPFLKDVEAARQHVAAVAAGAPAVAVAAEATAGRPATIPLRRRSLPGLSSAKVLVLTPNKGRFTRVLRLRFKALNGDYHLLHDPNAAVAKFDEVQPDLVVVDNRCDPDGKFVSDLKLEKSRSLTSVVKLYGKETDVSSEFDFKIWENDYLVEPFEVLELFTLSESELQRVPKDRRVLNQQVHFEFRTTRENVEKAHRLVDVVIRQSIFGEDDATALFAAVKEGIDNAAQHGNGFGSGKAIDVNVLVDQKKVTVIIEDQGDGFDYEYYVSRLDDAETFERAKRRIAEDNVRGGLGILLMHRCADRLEYSGLGNTLRLEKNF